MKQASFTSDPVTEDNIDDWAMVGHIDIIAREGGFSVAEVGEIDRRVDGWVGGGVE